MLPLVSKPQSLKGVERKEERLWIRRWQTASALGNDYLGGKGNYACGSVPMSLRVMGPRFENRKLTGMLPLA